MNKIIVSNNKFWELGSGIIMAISNNNPDIIFNYSLTKSDENNKEVVATLSSDNDLSNLTDKSVYYILKFYENKESEDLLATININGILPTVSSDYKLIIKIHINHKHKYLTNYHLLDIGDKEVYSSTDGEYLGDVRPLSSRAIKNFDNYENRIDNYYDRLLVSIDSGITEYYDGATNVKLKNKLSNSISIIRIGSSLYSTNGSGVRLILGELLEKLPNTSNFGKIVGNDSVSYSGSECRSKTLSTGRFGICECHLDGEDYLVPINNLGKTSGKELRILNLIGLDNLQYYPQYLSDSINVVYEKTTNKLIVFKLINGVMSSIGSLIVKDYNSSFEIVEVNNSLVTIANIKTGMFKLLYHHIDENGNLRTTYNFHKMLEYSARYGYSYIPKLSRVSRFDLIPTTGSLHYYDRSTNTITRLL